MTVASGFPSHLPTTSAPPRPPIFFFRLQTVGNSLRGVEEDIGEISGDIDDEDMLFPCLDFTLRVRCFEPDGSSGNRLSCCFFFWQAG